jgi:carboxypeptidase C (cathepsin A)
MRFFGKLLAVSIALTGLGSFALSQPAGGDRNAEAQTQKQADPSRDSAPQPRRASENRDASRQPGVLSLLPADSTTSHTLTIGNRALDYTATAGTIGLRDLSGEQTAAVFYTAYVAKGGTPARPVTFVFNGGPGAASAFLHLGLVGPRILDFGPSGRDGANARLIDNPQSWLEFTDLVLIDPVGTGWSRAAKQDDAGKFYGVTPDAQAIAKVIALYLANTGRIAAPKYLFGESYGGLRALKVAESLNHDQGIIVSGIVMLSPYLEGRLNFDATRFALGAALQLPSLAAAEMERTNSFDRSKIQDAERFAMTDYLTTLAGPEPEGRDAERFYARIAELTGMPIEDVRRTRGYIRDLYIKRAGGKLATVVSAYDGAVVASDPYPESNRSSGNDPVLDGFVRGYGGAFVDYARSELGFKTEMTYSLLTDGISEKWDWKGAGGRFREVSMSGDIRELLSINPQLRILIAQGYSDLVTPYMVSRYVVDHIPQSIRQNRLSLNVYQGGHMLYTSHATRVAFTEDAKRFFQTAPGATGE